MAKPFEVDKEALKANVRGSRTAEDVFDLVRLLVRLKQPPTDPPTVETETTEDIVLRIMQTLEGGTVNVDRLWERLAEMALGEIKEPKTFTPVQAEAFEKRQVPIGIYQGETIGDIPGAFWIRQREHPFNIEMKRYMQSDRFRQRKE